MDEDQVLLARLDQLVPKVDTSLVRNEQQLKRHIILDDTQEHPDDEARYVTGLNLDHGDEEITSELFVMKYTQGLQKLENQGFVDITNLAYWKASSYKLGNPIQHALDDNPQTYWQSDGSQPHHIDIHFSKRVEVIRIALYFSLFIDESYTPQKLKLYVGHSLSDATLYKIIEVKNVNGWALLTFEDNRPWDDLLKCHFLRLAIVSNHENGKDTHLRGIRIFAAVKKSYLSNTQLLECFNTGRLLSECNIR